MTCFTSLYTLFDKEDFCFICVTVQKKRITILSIHHDLGSCVYLPTKFYVVTTQNTTIIRVTTVRISNCVAWSLFYVDHTEHIINVTLFQSLSSYYLHTVIWLLKYWRYGKLGNIWILSSSGIFSVYCLIILKTIRNVEGIKYVCQSYLKHILFQQISVFRQNTYRYVFVCVIIRMIRMCYKYRVSKKDFTFFKNFSLGPWCDIRIFYIPKVR